MIHADYLNLITQAAKEKKYQNRLKSIETDMTTAANQGETFVYWDNNLYGQLKTLDKKAFVEAGFEVIEIHDEISNGYKIDWER